MIKNVTNIEPINLMLAGKNNFNQLKNKAEASNSSKMAASASDKQLKNACQEMESVFLNLLLNQMRATVPKNTLLGRSSEEDTMQSMLDTEMTKQLSKAGGIGLADMLYKQLSIDQKNIKSQDKK